MTSRLDRWRPLLLAIPFGILYRKTAAVQFSYDGVLYGLDVEFGSTGQLFHPGHLVYSFFFRELGQLLHLFGWSGRALFLMQNVNAWIGGLAVGLLAVVLSDRVGTWRGILFAGLFGVSHAFWGEAIDPGCYAMAGLGTVCVLALLLRAGDANAWQTGLLHGGLILIHQLLILSIPAFWVAIYRGQLPRGARLLRYTAGVLLTSALPYIFVAAYFHRGPLSEQLKWFFIPAGTPGSVGVLGNLWWSWSLVSNLRPFVAGLIYSVMAPGASSPLVPGLIAVGLLGAMVWQMIRDDSSRSQMVVLGAWIMPMSFFLFFFHHALRFHVLILPPILLALAILFGKVQREWWGAVALAGLVWLGKINYERAIAPRRSGGEEQQRVAWLQGHVRPADFLLFSGRGPHSVTNVYVAYFLTQIPARSLYGFLLSQFGQPVTTMEPLTAAFQATWQRGGRVWVEKDLLDPNIQAQAEAQMRVEKDSVSSWFTQFAAGQQMAGPGDYALLELKPNFQLR